MARQVYNFEIFTNKKEELRRIQKRRARNRRIKIAAVAVAAVILILLLYVLQNSRCTAYVYKDETDVEGSAGASYVAFSGGYLKYSGDGVEYQKTFGTSAWNVSVSFDQPFAVTSDNYAVVGDKGGNTLNLFDSDGEVSELTLKLPIVQADVSDQGMIEVILEGTDTNQIQVYDKEKNLIADMKSTIDETGYPLAAAISPDGTKLTVSYFAISALSSKTTVAFYDFSKQLQSDDVTLAGGFDYEDSMVPRLIFLSENVVAAVSDSALRYYNVADEPTLTKEIAFEQEVKSIFTADGYVGCVLDNAEEPDEGRYRIRLYDKKGEKKLDLAIDMEYESISLVDKEIIAFKDNDCTILNTAGKILFQGTLEGNHIESIIPIGGWRTYQVGFRDKSVTMSLRFH